MASNWTRGTLRISSRELSAQKIQEIVGHLATRSYSIGEPVSVRSTETLRSETLCLYECGAAASASVEARLDDVVQFVGEHGEQLRSIQSECEFEVILGCSSDNGQLGFVISSEVIKKISMLPIDLVVDAYFDE